MGLLLGLLFVASAPLSPGPTGQPAACAEQESVVLYSTSWCSWCHKARAWLNENGHAFTEHDVEREPGVASELEEKARRAGVEIVGVPVIDVNGTLVVGFDQPRLEQLFKQR